VHGSLAAITDAPATIVCVDCGGVCHLLTVSEPDGQSLNERSVHDDVIVAAYRCEDCLDRWDIELDPTDLS